MSKTFKTCTVFAFTIILFSIIAIYQTYTDHVTRRAKYFSDLETVETAGDAIKRYADDHKGRLTDSRSWEKQIGPYINRMNYTVALKEHTGNRLAMNSELSGVNVSHIVSNHLVQPDGPILLFETKASAKNTSGVPPWKEYHQVGISTKKRLMIAFASGWSYSYAEGPSGHAHFKD